MTFRQDTRFSRLSLDLTAELKDRRSRHTAINLTFMHPHEVECEAVFLLKPCQQSAAIFSIKTCGETMKTFVLTCAEVVKSGDDAHMKTYNLIHESRVKP